MAYKLLSQVMFQIIRTGIDASNKDLAVISNNIANAGTNGFKRSEAQVNLPVDSQMEIFQNGLKKLLY